MKLRIATWNMNYWQRSPSEREEAWRYLTEELAPDIALVQEAHPPDGMPRCVYREFPKLHQPHRRPWGTAVVALNPALGIEPVERVDVSPYLQPGQIEDSHPGASAVARITVPGVPDPVTAISFYGVIERATNNTSYATTAVGRMLSDLTPLLDAGRHRAPVVLGGDFNCSTQIEGKDRAAHEAVFTRLAAFGLTDVFSSTANERTPMNDCFCKQKGACSHQRTLRFRNKESSRPWHIDYFFTHHVDPAHQVVTVHDDERAWALSDHAPVVLTVDV